MFLPLRRARLSAADWADEGVGRGPGVRPTFMRAVGRTRWSARIARDTFCPSRGRVPVAERGSL